MRIYLYFRLFLALVLFGSFAAGLSKYLFGLRFPDLFISVAVLYVVVAAIALGFYQLQRHRLSQKQIFFTLLADILIQALLMFCSGGLSSGLGYLMLVTVAVGAIFFTGQLALLIPAIASICIIVESIVGSSVFDRDSVDVFPAGVLGVLLFASSLIFTKLSNALVVAQNVIKTTTALSAGLQELNQMIIDRMRTGIIVVDNSSTIQQINTAARELLGRRDQSNPLIIGEKISGETRLVKRLAWWKDHPDIKPKPFIPRIGSSELQANFASLETEGDDRTIIFLEDLRAQIQHAEQLKLASLGRLTGSIAHEIRNPLGAISHASELLNEIRHDDQTAIRLTEIINTHVKRVNHIVESILQLSRKQNHHLEKIDLPRWLQGFINDYKLGSRNTPEIDLVISPASIPPVTFDNIHLLRVLTNLLDNATRYSGENTGQFWAGIRLNLQGEDKIVTLDVVDRGTGVPANALGQLFEPFFSTSPGGSGLGLYIARELCAINYATIAYQGPQGQDNGFFRISFVHADKVFKLSEEGHDR